MISALLALAPLPGQRLEPMELIAPSGKPEIWRPARATVVTFVAMWCDTWRVQNPRIEKMRKATTGIDFLTVSVDGRFHDVPGAPAIYSDFGGRMARRLGIDRVPYTLVVDDGGAIRLARSGTLRWSDVLQALRSPAKVGGVYLTFDDFPPLNGGDDLLDALRREGVRATFFCICENAQKRPDLVRRAVREGHSLQVHAWSHTDAPDFDRCATLLRAFGATPSWQRAPGSERIFSFKGQPWEGTSVDPYDYRRPSVAELKRRILYKLKPGAAVQLHVGVDETLSALPEVISLLRQQGWRFLTFR